MFASVVLGALAGAARQNRLDGLGTPGGIGAPRR
jgi:hypothetical protein